MEDNIKLKQPAVFYLASATALCERFGYYVLAFTLTLYLKSVYQFSDHKAFALFAVFTALGYITPALGGYNADNLFGIRRSMIVGLLLEAIGLSFLALNGTFFFYLALTFIVLGVGFFKTSPTHLMARAYKENDPRIDGGFTLFYMFMNLGSFFSPIMVGYVQRYYGWHMAYFLGSLVLYAGLFVYFIFRKTAKDDDVKISYRRLPIKNILIVIAGTVIVGIITYILLNFTTAADIFFAIATAGILLYFFYEIIKCKKEDKLRIIACLLLIFIALMFFMLYYQLFESFTFFIKRCVSHHILGFDLPTPVFLSLNPIWVFILSPILAYLYSYFGKKGKDLAVTTKFPLGILLISSCFFLFKLSSFFGGADGQISSLWIFAGIGLFSLGELLVSALGVAMVTHIAPKRFYGVMMGTWFMIACAMSSALSGLFADLTSIPDTLTNPHVMLTIYGNGFLKIGSIALVVALFAFIISPFIKKMGQLD